ncbi:uncharacterized protein PHACADRAFT_139966 [Phanerochaete carnosa HHB-10118-sp]|uniref:DUF427 domain-containing protein n=1 Tax=Phanerochaete carnosa (strain HHB-10118-sp) TaxID=650164 RepID=K5V6A2_PHACS|nr:uncharacterized protein PHACADRAFT_139966 [Phanerochaete carnosa HHB-10118-sp]EKM58231.1 hypothetical protein PHACADRAFT_139966 [Phanerochaete carnosa HHB-10118-sp]
MSMSHSLFKLPHVESAPSRVRVLFGGQYIVDTYNAKLVWVSSYYPTYFFEAKDLPEKYLARSLNSTDDSKYEVYDVVIGSNRALGAATKYVEGELQGLISILFGAMDAWLEEDQQVFVHPKDPYKRVDVLQSSRHVRVEFNGQVLADTRRPKFLLETGLRRRTYIPKPDCNMQFWVESQHTTECPYKGVANYYAIRLPNGTEEPNSVWWYRNANPECLQIEGLVAFYDEKFDVYIDGELQKR